MLLPNALPTQAQLSDTDALGKFASARTISSPWPILASTDNNSGERILGMFFKITMI